MACAYPRKGARSPHNELYHGMGARSSNVSAAPTKQATATTSSAAIATTILRRHTPPLRWGSLNHNARWSFARQHSRLGTLASQVSPDTAHARQHGGWVHVPCH